MQEKDPYAGKSKLNFLALFVIILGLLAPLSHTSRHRKYLDPACLVWGRTASGVYDHWCRPNSGKTRTD